jgi:hypothetical protein
MPARTDKQRRFMGAELERKREGKRTRTDMTEGQLEDFASKPSGPTDSEHDTQVHHGEAGDRPDRP